MLPGEKKKILIINILLFALLFGLVSFNKQVIRPGYSHIPWVHLLSGSFPNFIAAYLIGLAFANGIMVRKLKRTRLFVYLSTLAVFIILTIEELAPMWGASTYYDPADIIASGIGSICTLLTFELITFSKRKSKSL